MPMNSEKQSTPEGQTERGNDKSETPRHVSKKNSRLREMQKLSENMASRPFKMLPKFRLRQDFIPLFKDGEILRVGQKVFL